MLLADMKFLFVHPFVLIICIGSADAFGIETGFEFSCCLCLEFYFYSPLHRVYLPARVRGWLACTKANGSWNVEIQLVLMGVSPMNFLCISTLFRPLCIVTPL